MEPQTTKPKAEEKAPSTPSSPQNYLEALEERVKFANAILSEFEKIRIFALDAKVPKPYQKRWQYDSNLFFKMAVRAADRLKLGHTRKA